jgi:hypothetical protein
MRGRKNTIAQLMTADFMGREQMLEGHGMVFPSSGLSYSNRFD